MTAWLAPVSPPATVEEWTALRDQAADAVRLAPWHAHLIIIIAWTMVAEAIVAALFYSSILFKKDRAPWWKMYELDPQGYARPCLQASGVVHGLYHASLTVVAVTLGHLDLRDGHTRTRTAVVVGLLFVGLLACSLMKVWAVIYLYFKTSSARFRKRSPGIPVPPSVFNVTIVAAFCSVPIVAITPFATVGDWLDDAWRIQEAFDAVVAAIVDNAQAPRGTSIGNDESLASSALSHLHHLRAVLYRSWTAARYLMACVNLLFAGTILIVGFCGWAVHVQLWSHVAICRRGARNLRELCQLQTAGRLDPASTQREAARALAEMERDGVVRITQRVWLDDGEEDAASQMQLRRGGANTEEERMERETDLKGQADRMMEAYRYSLRYTLALAFDLSAVVVVYCFLLAVCITIAIDPFHAPEKSNVTDVVFVGTLVAVGFWSVFFAIPVGITRAWLAFSPRPAPPALPTPHAMSTTEAASVRIQLEPEPGPGRFLKEAPMAVSARDLPPQLPNSPGPSASGCSESA